MPVSLYEPKAGLANLQRLGVESWTFSELDMGIAGQALAKRRSQKSFLLVVSGECEKGISKGL